MYKNKVSASEYIFMVLLLIFLSILNVLFNGSGSMFDILMSMILMCTIASAIASVINSAAEKCRSAFYGTVYGEVVIKDNDMTTIPLQNIEISYNSPFLEKPGDPVFSDAKGKFCFERIVPVDKPITLEAKIEKDRIIYQHIGKIEGVKWFLGKPSLRLPLSSGVPKHVNLVVPTLV